MPGIKVGFWNLENLFDTKISEIAADFHYTPANGWTKQVYDKKIENLASIIASMHNGDGPDILGVCEIENDDVLNDLKNEIGNNDLEFVQAPSPDIRGIDVGLFYCSDKLELKTKTPHLVHHRYPTRDILESKFKVIENNAELHVMVNHWPSRMRGKYETEPLRINVAEYCGRLVDNILKLNRKDFLALDDTQQNLDKINKKWNKNVLLMGDFNDEPFDRSILNYLQAVKDLDHIEELVKASSGQNIPNPKKYLRLKAYLFNCMWSLLGSSDVGTYHFSPSPNTMNMLDQFIISRGLYYGEQKLKMKLQSLNIFTDVIGTTKGRPRKFNWDNTKGYSDHFPIECVIDTL